MNPSEADAALVLARAQGCNCEPEITITTVGRGIPFAHIRHDSWCRLLANRAAPTN